MLRAIAHVGNDAGREKRLSKRPCGKCRTCPENNMEQKKLLTWEDTIHAGAELKIAFSLWWCMCGARWRSVQMSITQSGFSNLSEG